MPLNVRKLTPKQQAFADYYIELGNATESALKAGYSKRTAKETGYENYGGRGIKVCDRWNNFSNFIEDMGDRPSPDHTLDRIDVNGDYEPSNCRWATWLVQASNKRKHL